VRLQADGVVNLVSELPVGDVLGDVSTLSDDTTGCDEVIELLDVDVTLLLSLKICAKDS
jgi:hypothetical protein